jgi:hypothetical protein
MILYTVFQFYSVEDMKLFQKIKILVVPVVLRLPWRLQHLLHTAID